MPYELDGNCVKKKSGETIKCHDTHEEAVNHLQALQANVKDSAVVEMSLRITKASYNKSEDNPRRWMAIDSDTDDDLYQEKMSLELYQDFETRIKSNIPVPEQFKPIICEDSWCGGMPYLSIAHYKAGGEAKNVPGDVEAVYIDGNRLKSKGTLHDNPLGRKVFDSLVDDLYKKKSDPEHLPVRISIGFLDLEHKHRAQSGGQEFTFTRNNPGEICPLCAQGIGGKIYMKGQLVHLAMTRVPVNPRTAMEVERSMDDIKTKKDDAESIVGELANTLDEKSLASDVLVVRSDAPVAEHPELCEECYDPNTDSYDQDCVNRVMEKYVGKPREDGTVKSKALFDAVQKSIEKFNEPKLVVEEKMEQPTATVETTVSVNGEVTTQKGVLGIPEKPFTYAGLDGNGNNNIPNPVKAEGEEEEEKDGMEKSFATLRNLVKIAKAGGRTPEEYTPEINKAFAELGTAVEQAFVPQKSGAGVSASEIEQIMRSVVQPLQLEIATLKAQLSNKGNTVSEVVKSKALTLSGYPKPEDMIQRAIPQPERQLTQIQKIAYTSTGARR